MKIAIVILNWNGKNLLEKFIPSIVKYSAIQNATIYIADNASTDDSIAFVKSQYPSIKIIQNKENGGFAKGYNDALKHVEADIFALVNSDIEVTKNWLEPILKEFQKNANTVVVQPKILDYKKKTHFEYAGAAGGFIDKYGYPFCRGRLFNTLEADNGQYNDTVEIAWASGACFFIRASVFNASKGFDEDFFAHQEEIDLCWRILNNGYSIKYINQSLVYHVGGATLSETSPKKTYLNYRNSLFTLVKNLPANKLIPILFVRLALDGISGAKFLFEFKTNHLLAILKSHVSFYMNLHKTYKKRGENQRTDYYKTNSIVLNYFIKGIKKYSQL